jgi:hypothetical protein
MPQAGRASLLGRRAEVHLEQNRSLGGVADSGAVPWMCGCQPLPSEQVETWFGSRSACRPLPSQVARQARGDRRGRGRGAPTVIVP